MDNSLLKFFLDQDSTWKFRVKFILLFERTCLVYFLLLKGTSKELWDLQQWGIGLQMIVFIKLPLRFHYSYLHNRFLDGSHDDLAEQWMDTLNCLTIHLQSNGLQLFQFGTHVLPHTGWFTKQFHNYKKLWQWQDISWAPSNPVILSSCEGTINCRVELLPSHNHFAGLSTRVVLNLSTKWTSLWKTKTTGPSTGPFCITGSYKNTTGPVWGDKLTFFVDAE